MCSASLLLHLLYRFPILLDAGAEVIKRKGDGFVGAWATVRFLFFFFLLFLFYIFSVIVICVSLFFFFIFSFYFLLFLFVFYVYVFNKKCVGHDGRTKQDVVSLSNMCGSYFI